MTTTRQLWLHGLLFCADERRRVIEDGAILIEGDRIKEVGLTHSLQSRYPGVPVRDCQGRLVTPGAVNMHTHFYSAFARGMDLKTKEPPANFPQILEKLWWRLDRKLNHRDIYYSALTTILYCLQNGVTTVFDHHASQGAITGSLGEVARAVHEGGIRASLCYEITDRDGEKKGHEGIRENASFAESLSPSDKMIKTMVGLHASFTVSDATIKKVLDTFDPATLRCHIHTAEDYSDREHAIRTHRMGVIQRLVQRGILNRRGLAIHAIHLDSEDRRALLESGVGVIHNPQSNMGNAVGVMELLPLFQEGARLGMGSDGYTANIFEELRVAQLLQKSHHRDPRLAWNEPVEMVLFNNPALATEQFELPLGRIEPGAMADLVVVDYLPPTPMNERNFGGHFIFGRPSAPVRTTMVGGRVVYDQGEFKLGIDADKVFNEARSQAEDFWKRF